MTGWFCVWVIYSIFMIGTIRIGLSGLYRLTGASRGALSFAYFCLLLCFPLGWVITAWSGMQMYGFDSGDWRQNFGYYTFILSPAGAPLLIGLPVILIADTIGRFVRKNEPEEHAHRD